MPAEAMRPPRPALASLAKLARRLGGAPLALRMAVRDVLGRPTRSAGTALGVAAALVLVLTTSAMLESMGVTFTSIFDVARRYELRVDLARPEGLAEAKARFGAIQGVIDTEGLLVLPAQVRKGDRVETVELDGIKPDAKLFRSMDADGRPVAVHKGSVILTRATGREVELIVDGFADAALHYRNGRYPRVR